MPKIKDITGEKFNYLTVIEYIGIINNRSLWRCKCDCGNEKIARSDHLKSGNTKSCGCYTTGGYKYIIDTEDLPRIKDIC